MKKRTFLVHPSSFILHPFRVLLLARLFAAGRPLLRTGTIGAFLPVAAAAAVRAGAAVAFAPRAALAAGRPAFAAFAALTALARRRRRRGHRPGALGRAAL